MRPSSHAPSLFTGSISSRAPRLRRTPFRTRADTLEHAANLIARRIGQTRVASRRGPIEMELTLTRPFHYRHIFVVPEAPRTLALEESARSICGRLTRLPWEKLRATLGTAKNWFGSEQLFELAAPMIEQSLLAPLEGFAAARKLEDEYENRIQSIGDFCLNPGWALRPEGARTSPPRIQTKRFAGEICRLGKPSVKFDVRSRNISDFAWRCLPEFFDELKAENRPVTFTFTAPSALVVQLTPGDVLTVLGYPLGFRSALALKTEVLISRKIWAALDLCSRWESDAEVRINYGLHALADNLYSELDDPDWGEAVQNLFMPRLRLWRQLSKGQLPWGPRLNPDVLVPPAPVR